MSLNPYSTGSWFAGRSVLSQTAINLIGLNPYSTGSWFAGNAGMTGDGIPAIQVLILILLEVGLLEYRVPYESLRRDSVLILILLEVGLLDYFEKVKEDTKCVLILILLEVGLLVLELKPSEAIELFMS